MDDGLSIAIIYAKLVIVLLGCLWIAVAVPASSNREDSHKIFSGLYYFLRE